MRSHKEISRVFRDEDAKKSELFFENKRKKQWVDKVTGHRAIMLCARSLDVTWGGQSHWDWNCFKELREEKIEVAKLSHVCWLDVRGKLKLSELSPSTTYEIAYVIKLTKTRPGGSFRSLSDSSIPILRPPNAVSAFSTARAKNGSSSNSAPSPPATASETGKFGLISWNTEGIGKPDFSFKEQS